jgi:hypothetical protein
VTIIGSITRRHEILDLAGVDVQPVAFLALRTSPTTTDPSRPPFCASCGAHSGTA